MGENEKGKDKYVNSIMIKFRIRIFSMNLDQKKFAVFCLARIGCEIIDTQLKSIDKQSTEVLFTDNLTL